MATVYTGTAEDLMHLAAEGHLDAEDIEVFEIISLGEVRSRLRSVHLHAVYKSFWRGYDVGYADAQNEARAKKSSWLSWLPGLGSRPSTRASDSSSKPSSAPRLATSRRRPRFDPSRTTRVGGSKRSAASPAGVVHPQPRSLSASAASRAGSQLSHDEVARLKAKARARRQRS